MEVPSGYLAQVDQQAFHVLIGRLDGENVATAMAFDHGGDCGIYNVTTQEHAHRRGLGAALTLLHLHDARARGCRTASPRRWPSTCMPASASAIWAGSSSTRPGSWSSSRHLSEAVRQLRRFGRSMGTVLVVADVLVRMSLRVAAVA
jgi:hypothetical protein